MARKKVENAEPKTGDQTHIDGTQERPAIAGMRFCLSEAKSTLGERGHWWCEEPDGAVVDPTAAQFPSLGNGEYRELGETVRCSNCGSEVLLDEAVTRSNYAFCSGTCHGQFVGVL